MLNAEEYTAALTLFNYLTVKDTPKKADVIIGFGTYHLGAAKKAADLWHQGFAPYIIFSGYKNDRYHKTEAAMLKETAIEHGVPQDVIFTEDHASNTGLNITLSYALAQEKKLLKTNRVILIHKPYMSRRTYATAKAQWPDSSTTFYIAPADVTLDEYFEHDGVSQTIRSMLADFYCIKAYPAKGWQIAQDVPAEVERASQLLIDRGHTLTIPM